jgi:transcription initiation factor TFIIIB Brf1 subunit/transcription initiation factor TFIIB
MTTEEKTETKRCAECSKVFVVKDYGSTTYCHNCSLIIMDKLNSGVHK